MVTVIGFFAQLAPSGFSRDSTIALLLVFTFIVNAIHFPSGDQDKLDGDSGNCVIALVSPLLNQYM